MNHKHRGLLCRARANRIAGLLLVILTLLLSTRQGATQGAGYAEYYIPGHEQQLWEIFVDLDNDPVLDSNQGTHTTIAIAIESDNTTIYYDHWEDGYDFDPDAPDPAATADEYYVGSAGEVLKFESSNIPVPRGSDVSSVSLTDCGGAACYDGRDRIFTAGGATSVTRTFWPESIGAVFAIALEVYPVKPSTTTYTVPIGEELASGPAAYDDFDSVYILVQSLADDNVVLIDDPTTGGVDVSATLQRGEVTQLHHTSSNTTIDASHPLQVQFLVGQGQSGGPASEIRGFYALPDTIWSNSYYAPVGGFSNADTDIFLFNPQDDPITVSFEDSLGAGSFSLPAGTTYAYSDSNAAGRLVPSHSAVYLEADAPFWGIATIDSEDYNYDWGYSLLPANILEDEYFLGWAPGTRDLSANGSPVFVTPVNDDTTIFVDYSPADGAADAAFRLDRLESQAIYDTTDNDNSGMRVWGTGPFAMAWGQDPEEAEIWDPYLDLGYTALPMRDEWLDAVLGIEKSASPDVVPIGIGQVTTFTLSVSTFDYAVNDIVVTDTLPLDWAYVPGSAAITRPDGSYQSGAAADPLVNGQTLSWDDLGATPGTELSMAANETLTITLQATTVAELDVGFSRNEAQAAGTRPAGSITQTFIASDSVQVYVSDLSVSKQATAPEPLLPGDLISYTINIQNIGGVPQSGLTVTDPLPAGLTYVNNSAWITAPTIGPETTYGDNFATVAYNNSDGTGDWSGNAWLEDNDDGAAGSGQIQIDNDELVFHGDDNNDSVSLTRDLDLTGVVSATLSFDYWEQGRLESNDRVVVSVYSGTSWYELLTLSNDFGSDTHHFSQSISNFVNPAFKIRITVTGYAGGSNPPERFFLDNLLITTQTEGPPATVASSGPPQLIAAGDGYGIWPGQTITITLQATVDDPFDPLLAPLVNEVKVTSDQQLGPIYASVSNDVLTCSAPAAPTVAVTQLDATSIQLTWSAIDDVASYHIYRDTTPYFTPAEPPYQIVTGTSFDDSGVLGTADTQYYYVVRSACASSETSANSNRVGAYNFGLSSPLPINFNDISLVLEVAGVTDAASLATYAGSSVLRVMRYNNATQSFQTYVPGFATTNFALSLGEYIFLLTSSAAPATLPFVGHVPDPGAVSFSLTSGAGVAFNTVSLPLDQAALIDAAGVAADVGPSALRIMRYQAGSQTFQTYVTGFPTTNYSLLIGEPFIMLTGPGIPATWP